MTLEARPPQAAAPGPARPNAAARIDAPPPPCSPPRVGGTTARRIRRRAQHGLLATATALLLATATPPALAQKPGGASEPDPTKSATTMLYNEGVAFAKKGEWEKAYQSFQSAWKLREHWQIAANLGRAELKTGRHVAAAEHLSFFLREAKEVPAADRAAVQNLLAEAKQHIGTLIVKVNRPGAEVLLDDRSVGQAPLSRELYVDAGSHTLEARLGAEKAEPVTVDLTAGQSRQVGLTFGGGTSTVGETKPVQPVQPVQPAESQRQEGGPSTALIIAGGATAGVALISGLVFTGLANAKSNDSRQVFTGWEACYKPGGGSGLDSTKCQEVDDHRQAAAAFSNIAVWSFIGAGTVGAATLVYALVASGSNSTETSTRVMPVALDRGAGISVGGRW